MSQENVEIVLMAYAAMSERNFDAPKDAASLARRAEHRRVCHDGNGEFVMMGKCFKGLTDELLEWQTKELLTRETGRQGSRCSCTRSRACRS
jgi:hypothetical protein